MITNDYMEQAGMEQAGMEQAWSRHPNALDVETDLEGHENERCHH